MRASKKPAAHRRARQQQPNNAPGEELNTTSTSACVGSITHHLLRVCSLAVFPEYTMLPLLTRNPPSSTTILRHAALARAHAASGPSGAASASAASAELIGSVPRKKASPSSSPRSKS